MLKNKHILPAVSRQEFEELTAVLDELEGTSGHELARGGVAFDNLAGKLRVTYLNKPVSNRLLSIYEVIDLMDEAYVLGKLVLSARDKIEELIEDSYDREDDDEFEESIAAWAAMLVKELRKAIRTVSE